MIWNALSNTHVHDMLSELAHIFEELGVWVPLACKIYNYNIRKSGLCIFRPCANYNKGHRSGKYYHGKLLWLCCFTFESYLNNRIWHCHVLEKIDLVPVNQKFLAILYNSKYHIHVLPSRDLASDPSARLFRRAIVIFDGQKNDHDGFVYWWAKLKLVKYSTYICTLNGKYQPVSTISYHLLNDNYTQNIIRRL